MRLKNSDLNDPILLGFPTGPNTLAVWCPYCARWHYHGREPGMRVAHCINPQSPFKQTGYRIMEGSKKDLNLQNTNRFTPEFYPEEPFYQLRKDHTL